MEEEEEEEEENDAEDGEDSPTMLTEDEPDNQNEWWRNGEVDEAPVHTIQRTENPRRAEDVEVRAGLVRPNEDPRLRLHRTQARPAYAVRNATVPTVPSPAMTYQSLVVNAAAASAAPSLHASDSTATVTPATFGMIERPRHRAFGQDSFVESSSPTLPVFRSNASDVGSARSSGTNNSNGAGFFRTYQDNPGSSRSTTGVRTPDLVYAELGHGRGRNIIVPSGPATHLPRPTAVRSGSIESSSRSDNSGSSRAYQPWTALPPNARHSPLGAHELDRVQVLADAMHSYHRPSGHEGSEQGWPMHREPQTPLPHFSSSPTTRELQESVHTALGGSLAPTIRQPPPSPVANEEQPESSRGRHVRKSWKNTLNVAEYYASSFFKRGSSTSGPGRNGGSSSSGATDRSGR